jgi:hypothetical protein
LDGLEPIDSVTAKLEGALGLTARQSAGGGR